MFLHDSHEYGIRLYEFEVLEALRVSLVGDCPSHPLLCQFFFFFFFSSLNKRVCVRTTSVNDHKSEK